MVIPTFGCPRLPHRQRVESCCREYDLDYRCLSIVLHEVGQSQARKGRCGRGAGWHDGEADPRPGLEASCLQMETIESESFEGKRWQGCERGGKDCTLASRCQTVKTFVYHVAGSSLCEALICTQLEASVDIQWVPNLLPVALTERP